MTSATGEGRTAASSWTDPATTSPKQNARAEKSTSCARQKLAYAASRKSDSSEATDATPGRVVPPSEDVHPSEPPTASATVPTLETTPSAATSHSRSWTFGRPSSTNAANTAMPAIAMRESRSASPVENPTFHREL